MSQSVDGSILDENLERKVVQGWDRDKDIFDNLKVGDFVKTHPTGPKKIVSSKEENNSIMLCSRSTSSHIETEYFEWNDKSGYSLDAIKRAAAICKETDAMAVITGEDIDMLEKKDEFTSCAWDFAVPILYPRLFNNPEWGLNHG